MAKLLIINGSKFHEEKEGNYLGHFILKESAQHKLRTLSSIKANDYRDFLELEELFLLGVVELLPGIL